MIIIDYFYCKLGTLEQLISINDSASINDIENVGKKKRVLFERKT